VLSFFNTNGEEIAPRANARESLVNCRSGDEFPAIHSRIGAPPHARKSNLLFFEFDLV
jgi:hypothetical protein